MSKLQKKEAKFTVNDIEELQFRIMFKKNSQFTTQDLLRSIKGRQFLSGNILVNQFIEFVEDRVASFVLSGIGFEIKIFSSEIRLSFLGDISLLKTENIPDTKNYNKEELFSANSLNKINIDYNTIIEFVLTKLNVDIVQNQLFLSIHLRKPHFDYLKNHISMQLDPILATILDDETQIMHCSVNFTTKEIFLNDETEIHYSLFRKSPIDDSEKINAVVFEGNLIYRNNGVQDLHLIVTKYLERINYVTEKLVGGLQKNV